MSKEKPVKYVKNKISNNDVNDTYIEGTPLDKYETDEEDNQNKEYYLETLNIIQQNIIEYVEEKSIPLCEYLTIKNIGDMLYNKINF
jgi:hypothetical protein